MKHDEFLMALRDLAYNKEAKANFMYGCSKRIHTSPMFIMNGIVIDGAQNWKELGWTDYIIFSSL